MCRRKCQYMCRFLSKVKCLCLCFGMVHMILLTAETIKMHFGLTVQNGETPDGSSPGDVKGGILRGGGKGACW